MKINCKKSLIIIAAICGFFPLTSYAATQGTLGPTSTGTLNITAQIQDLVIITGLADIDLTGGVPYSGTGALTGSSTFCVYRNGTGNYSATLTGSGGITPGFFIKNGIFVGADEMPYTVTYTDGTNTYTSPTDFVSGGTIGTLATPLLGDSASQTCVGSGGTNGTITVDILEAEAQAANIGNYSGTLTILISPL